MTELRDGITSLHGIHVKHFQSQVKFPLFQLQTGDSLAVTKMLDHVPFPALKVVALVEVSVAALEDVAPVDISMLVFRLVISGIPRS